MPPILLIGLNPLDPPPGAPVPASVLAQIAASIGKDLGRAARNGYPCTPHYLDWRDPEKGFKVLEEVLKAGAGAGAGAGQAASSAAGEEDGGDRKGEGEKWAAVLVGQGLRKWQDPLLFEGAINVVHRVCSRETRILFNDGPERSCVAIERGFGVVLGE